MSDHDILVLLMGFFLLAFNLLGATLTVRQTIALRRSRQKNAETKADIGLETTLVEPASYGRGQSGAVIIQGDDLQRIWAVITSDAVILGEKELPIADIIEAKLLKHSSDWLVPRDQISRYTLARKRIAASRWADSDFVLHLRLPHSVFLVGSNEVFVRTMLREIQDAQSKRDPRKSVRLNASDAVIDMWVDEGAANGVTS
jgi:hypothetical protein